MLGFASSLGREGKRDKNVSPAAPDATSAREKKSEDLTPSAPRNSRTSKRNSGFFDVGYTQAQIRGQEQPPPASIQRRTSKRASSQDRHGHVYGDDMPSFRPETPNMSRYSPENQTSPMRDDAGISPRRQRDDSLRYDVSAGPPQVPPREASDPSKTPREGAPRPRTRTMEDMVRSKSPHSSKADNRKRMGSFQSVGHLPLQEENQDDGNSIGYPSVIATNLNTPTAARARMVRPASPSNTVSTAEVSTRPSAATSATAVNSHDPPFMTTSSPESDAQRIKNLMKMTAGRMHGILYFRFAKTAVWQSGFCAINASEGTLIYQTKGELAQTKTLIPDLRGCKVRTQVDQDSQAPFLEMSTKASGFGIHLRPWLAETFESWLAALLCWQPIKPAGAQHRELASRQRRWRILASKPVSGTSTPTSETLERASSRATLRSKQSADLFSPMRDAHIIKTARVLWWDPTAPQSNTLSTPRRVSTYKQQRMAAGPPWRKAMASVRENGLFDVLLDTQKDQGTAEKPQSVIAAADLTALKRYAVQKLHESVLDDEFTLAVFPQYTGDSRGFGSDIDDDEDAVQWPIYLSFETRITLEAWYATLRAFTVPELYGPDLGPPEPIHHPMDEDPPNQELPKDAFRLKRSLFIRITEAHLHAARPVSQDPPPQAHSRDGSVVGDYHAEIYIDGDVRGRTSIQYDTSNPFWRNDYEFNHLPPFATTATIEVKSRQADQRDWTLVSDGRYTQEDFKEVDHLDMVEDIHISPLDSLHGTLELKLDEMERGAESEQWWTLTNEYGEPTGRILLKLRIDETVILMSNEYNELSSLLHAFSNGIATDVVQKCTERASYIPKTLLNIFQVDNSAGRWINTMVEDEIDGLQREVSASKYRFSRRIASNDSYDSGVERELTVRDLGKTASANANLLFRGNTPLTKALEMHMRRLAREYLEEVLGEQLRDIDESEPECEVDPNRVQNPEALQRNWRNLILLTESIWRSISTSANSCPAELRQIFRVIRACTEDRYGAFLRTVPYSSVSAFLFLRLIVPAILNPSLLGLLKEVPRIRSRRTLTLIAKSLQALANMTTFGAKEPWMEPMNAFLNGHRQEFKDFIDEMCSISQERASQPPQAPSDFIAPISVADRLPAGSKEGFPSLPYLIDQPREFAILVNAWLDSRGQTAGIPIVTEDLARLDVLCGRLRARAIDLVRRTAENHPSDPSGNDWAKLLKQLEERGKGASRMGSRVTSPLASPKPTQEENSQGPEPPRRTSSQNSRPQPIRTRSSQTAPMHRSSMPSGSSQPPSAGSGDGFYGNRAGATNFLLSPSQSSFGDGVHDEENRASPAESASNEGGSERPRDRITSIASGPGGYIHPLAWGDPGSAGSGRSKASSLHSLDMHAANNASMPMRSRDDSYPMSAGAVGALPLPGSAGSSTHGHLLGIETENSPIASPRDPSDSNTRFFGKLTSGFGRRDKKDKPEKERRGEDDDAARKARKKEEKRREKEEKEAARRKEKGRPNREGSTVARLPDSAIDAARANFGI